MSDKPKSVGAVALGWWGRNLDADTGAARALGARLRRADVVEALSERAVVGLLGELGDAGHAPARDRLRREPERLALIARTLAHVEAHTPGRRLAQALGGDPPSLSALRFQRLIRTAGPQELGVALRRALPAINNACNVAALANDLLWWGERARVDWCFDYFGAPAAAPERPVDQSAEEAPA